jgi:DNA-binding LacI/PurR family transcriptional regulator
MALGAIAAMQQSGIRVREDVSVIGYDGIEIGEFFTPSLTTIAHNHMRQAVRTAEVLLELVHGGTGKAERILPSLVVRDSVGKVPKRLRRW